ncbi:hypothetical protein [Cryobacterium sp. CG_9.6]|uniref:hypothetical protein n=1 Tax=Cryobacterium sp. CG_9.6 TaxID=2760710 RepID=UPI0024734ADD|nr:hypothetical protein [Cryobacterium sp. CG_9.6]MDH6237952.1 hypothetical protein [Cryobacterium sp. CG_9.6]
MNLATDTLIPPRYGWRRAPERLSIGLLVVCVGVGATSLSSTYSLWFLAIGPLLQGIGWLMLPSALWRRLVVLLPCLLAGVVLLSGVEFVGAFAVLLAGWLLVRGRPTLTYVVLLLPIAASVGVKILLGNYEQNLLALVIGTIATVAGAWLAAWGQLLLHDRATARVVTA